ncbi:MAG: EamA family transporter RarD [Candidatus Sedimenticola sp. PURPLELP]
MTSTALPAATVRMGVLASLGAYLLWGFSPIFYRLLGEASALEILAHRAVWSLAFTLVLVVTAGNTATLLKILANRRLMGVLLISSILVSVNWLIFIWAVNNDKVLEASMGYFIMPIVMVLLGRIFLTEHLSRFQLVSVLLACVGVLNLLVTLGQLPWVALTLAVSFGSYGLVRKMAPVDSILGLTVECLLLTPVALIYLAYLYAEGTLVFATRGLSLDLLLMSSALMTALPLILFTTGAKRLRYATAGMLSYINPTIQFLLAVLLFQEPFTSSHLVTFSLIWLGLGIFSYDARRLAEQNENRRP